MTTSKTKIGMGGVSADRVRQLDIAKQQNNPLLYLKEIVKTQNSAPNKWNAVIDIHFVNNMIAEYSYKGEIYTPSKLLEMMDLTLELYREFSDNIAETGNRRGHFSDQSLELGLELKVIENLLSTLNPLIENHLKGREKFDKEKDNLEYERLIPLLEERWENCMFNEMLDPDKKKEKKIYDRFVNKMHKDQEKKNKPSIWGFFGIPGATRRREAREAAKETTKLQSPTVNAFTVKEYLIAIQEIKASKSSNFPMSNEIHNITTIFTDSEKSFSLKQQLDILKLALYMYEYYSDAIKMKTQERNKYFTGENIKFGEELLVIENLVRTIYNPIKIRYNKNRFQLHDDIKIEYARLKEDMEIQQTNSTYGNQITIENNVYSNFLKEFKKTKPVDSVGAANLLKLWVRVVQGDATEDERASIVGDRRGEEVTSSLPQPEPLPPPTYAAALAAANTHKGGGKKRKSKKRSKKQTNKKNKSKKRSKKTKKI